MRRGIIACIIIMLCMCLCACGLEQEQKQEVQDTQEEQGQKEQTTGELPAFSTFPESMPKFETVDLKGNTVTDDIFTKADLTVVNFWATYCNPCIDELPELGEWSASMPENVQLIGIVVDVRENDSTKFDLAVQIADKTRADYPHILPGTEFDDIIAEIVGVPTTFFVDSEGKIVGEPIVGADVDGCKEYVESYLSGQGE